VIDRVTGSTPSIRNLIKCVQNAGIQIDALVLEPLGSGEAVLTEIEREMGVVLVDIGGGTTDIAIFIEGSIWHTMVLPTGGEQLTNDIAVGLRTPFNTEEDLKIKYGHARSQAIMPEEMIKVNVFGEDGQQHIARQFLAEIIEARAEEILEMVMKEIKRSGYDGLLPAGMILTGGTAALPGIRRIAHEVLGMPVRIAQPENLTGLTDKLNSPAFSTSVGLLRWALTMNEHDLSLSVRSRRRRRTRGEITMDFEVVKNWLKRLLP
jgi:cell division protein FtsA